MTRHLSHGQSTCLLWSCQHLAVPSHIEGEAGEIEADGTADLYSELTAAGIRALTVQQNRNKRRAEV